ncbi:MAG: TonB-dependent receptor [Ignavibacteria bacterium]|nr:TonB-dependent receptor [Ignavibacteria bacterium]
MIMRTRSVLVLLLLLTTPILIHAGETGKLAGTVYDAETRERLIGVNIVIAGTTLGAATDATGFYFINNVPPGSYEVRISMVGYQTVVFQDVRIRVDVTTELNAALSSSAIELGREIVVTAEQPVVQKDRTATRTIVEGSTVLRDLRLQEIGEILTLQAGVTRGTEGTLHIRGGRAGGMVYQIDGVPVTNPFGRTLAGEMEVENVQELQAHLGTFDAEYGNAADGVVSIYTKDGGDKYAGRFYYESAQINPSPYHKKDWNLDRSDIRNLPPDQQQRYLDAVRKPDGTSAYDYVSVLDDPYAKPYLLVHALGTWSGNISGPVPFLPRIKFFATGRMKNEDSQLPFGYSLYRSATFKLTYPLSPLFTLRTSADWSNDHRQTYNHEYKYWRWFDSGLDALGRKGSYPIEHSAYNRQAVSARHVLSSSTFYDVAVARIYDFNSEIVPGRTVVFDETTGTLASSDYLTRLYVGGVESNFRFGDVRYWRKTESVQYLAKGNIESQIDNHHQIRSGFEIKTHEIFRHRIGMPPRANLEFFTHKPLEISWYVQDKIEYTFMVLKVGLRVDYFSPQTTAYPDVANILTVRTTPTGTSEYVAVDRERVKPHMQVSPRIGMAHPISDRTSIHFAYGHFFQIPTFYDLFRNDALNDLLVNDALVGNPGLKPEKTVSYEVGLQQQLARDWAVNLTAYSKDITNLISSYYYFVGRDYTIFTNADYGRVQGIDLTLDKRFSDSYAARVTYSLLYALGNESDPTEGYSSYREETAHLRPNRNFPLDFDQRHKINATLIVRLPEDFGPEFFGIHPLEQFSLSAIFTSGSGLPYTPSSRAAEESNIVPDKNSARRPWTNMLDIKVSREFRIAGTRLTAYFDAENVLDALNTVRVWTHTGEPWTQGPTSIFTQDRQANPRSVGPRRALRFGFFVDF